MDNFVSFIILGFTITAGSIGGLALWIFNLSKELKMANGINDKLNALCVSVDKIEKAMTGDMERKGIITKIHEHETRINDIEKK